jgi:hypothetical protein
MEEGLRYKKGGKYHKGGKYSKAGKHHKKAMHKGGMKKRYDHDEDDEDEEEDGKMMEKRGGKYKKAYKKSLRKSLEDEGHEGALDASDVLDSLVETLDKSFGSFKKSLDTQGTFNEQMVKALNGFKDEIGDLKKALEDFGNAPKPRKSVSRLTALEKGGAAPTPQETANERKMILAGLEELSKSDPLVADATILYETEGVIDPAIRQKALGMFNKLGGS